MAQINKPSDYFNTKLYTGNGTDDHAITGVGFQPDWVWLKSRTSGDKDHDLYDVVRGATKRLKSNGADGEGTSASALKSFDTDGFTLGTDGRINASSNSMVSWNWLAGGTASSNTDGSITSSVSANTTSGFSIVSYTGTGAIATVGHGLNSAPKMIFIKNRNLTSPNEQDWSVYNKDIGAGNFLFISRNNASASAPTRFNSTDPTSSVFTLGTHASGNGSSNTYIAYCFSDVKGFSKIGTYTGNGNADGTFVYTGFRPAFVLLKNADGTYNWNMQDNKRDTFNPVDKHIAPNGSSAEATSSSYNVDFLSNGFKLRNSLAVWNGSGNTHIYMAFAENPLVGTNNIPATAR